MSTMFVFAYSDIDGIIKFREISAESKAEAHKAATNAAMSMADIESCASFWGVYDEKYTAEMAFNDFLNRRDKFKNQLHKDEE